MKPFAPECCTFGRLAGEKAIFSSPVDVHVVANVIAAAALGQMDRSVVPTRRRQGFWSEEGAEITHADVIYVDGTNEIERVSKAVDLDPIPLLKWAQSSC